VKKDLKARMEDGSLSPKAFQIVALIIFQIDPDYAVTWILNHFNDAECQREFQSVITLVPQYVKNDSIIEVMRTVENITHKSNWKKVIDLGIQYYLEKKSPYFRGKVVDSNAIDFLLFDDLLYLTDLSLSQPNSIHELTVLYKQLSSYKKNGIFKNKYELLLNLIADILRFKKGELDGEKDLTAWGARFWESIYTPHIYEYIEKMYRHYEDMMLDTSSNKILPE